MRSLPLKFQLFNKMSCNSSRNHWVQKHRKLTVSCWTDKILLSIKAAPMIMKTNKGLFFFFYIHLFQFILGHQRCQTCQTCQDNPCKKYGWFNLQRLQLLFMNYTSKGTNEKKNKNKNNWYYLFHWQLVKAV